MSDEYVVTPYTIIIDSREQASWSFTGFRTDARQGKKPLFVCTEVAGLKTGDYSLKGFEERTCIERKSKSDCWSTIIHERDRFERELERMQAMDFAAVVVEASWESMLWQPPEHTKASPKSIYRSVIAWQQRYPRCHWWFCVSRTFAERTTLRMLERFYLDEMERIKAAG